MGPCDLPVVLYNVPGRTVADLANDTIVRLAQVPGVIGLKDATGDMPRLVDLLSRVPATFAVYSGNDDSALALIALGGHGVISVTANVAPREMAQLSAAALAGDLKSARAMNTRLMPLHTDLFVEANPIPVKWAMARLGLRPDETLIFEDSPSGAAAGAASGPSPPWPWARPALPLPRPVRTRRRERG